MVKMYWCPFCSEQTYVEDHACFDCRGEIERIKQQRRIAERAGTSYDLTHVQWRKTVEHFKGNCAYCEESAPYLFIEHFVPVSLGGGTTISNCVPACMRCNNRKRDLHPDQVLLIPHADLERVRVFLERQILPSK